jgi:tetratricopeptide (TPR) repeat protein
MTEWTTLLQRAVELLRAQRFQDVLDLLTPRLSPHAPADIWQLVGLAYKGVSNITEAERAMRTSLAIQPRQQQVHANLGNLLRQEQRLEDALVCYQEALAIDPDFISARVSMGHCYRDLHRVPEAVAAFEEVLTSQPQHIGALLGLAMTLQADGALEAAAGIYEHVLSLEPANTTALNGCGNILKVMGFPDEGVAYLEQAVAQEPQRAVLWANYASALALASREDEAVSAYQKAVELDPDNVEYHQWLNGYLDVIDHPAHLQSYNQRLRERPSQTPLRIACARKLLLLGRVADARATVEEGFTSALPATEEAQLRREHSYILRESGDFSAAVAASQRASDLDSDAVSVLQEYANALLADGSDPEAAMRLLERALAQAPNDQGLWALMTTALRYAQHHQAYRRLVNYDTLVHHRVIETPTDYASLPAFVDALRTELLRLHTGRRHPVEQSAVNGTQTLDDLFSRRNEMLGLLQGSLRAQILGVLSGLSKDPEHPLLSRLEQDIAFSDSWSIRLQQSGYHKDHFHPAGWYSSAFYVVVPDCVHQGQGEGWIKFGQPGFRARYPLGADFYIKPEAGSLVLFPSYLWHGTVPIEHARERMTVGYDVLPDRGQGAS